MSSNDARWGLKLFSFVPLWNLRSIHSKSRYCIHILAVFPKTSPPNIISEFYGLIQHVLCNCHSKVAQTGSPCLVDVPASERLLSLILPSRVSSNFISNKHSSPLSYNLMHKNRSVVVFFQLSLFSLEPLAHMPESMKISSKPLHLAYFPRAPMNAHMHVM